MERTTFLMQQALASSIMLPRPRSRSVSRTTSIPSLGKLFSSSEDTRFPTTSHSSDKKNYKSLPQPANQQQDKRPHVHSWNGVPAQYINSPSLLALSSSKLSEDEKGKLPSLFFYIMKINPAFALEKRLTCDALLLDMASFSFSFFNSKLIAYLSNF